MSPRPATVHWLQDRSIRTKGLLLVGVPLVFQLVLLAAYARLSGWLRDAQVATAASRIVTQRTEELYRRTVDAQGELRGYLLTGDPAMGVQARLARERAGASLVMFEALTAEANDGSHRNALIGATRERLAHLDELQQLAEAGAQRQVVGGYVEDGFERMSRFKVQADRFLSEQDARDADRSAALAQAVRAQAAVIAAAIALGTLIALASVVGFARGVAGRLATVASNVARMSSGDDLLPPLRGRDEIASLDRSFRDMASQLNRRRTELEISNRELEQFAAVASHDLQEPLRKIVAFADRLSASAGTALDATSRDYVQRIVDSAARMRAHIDALLGFARLSSRSQRFQACEPAALAREAVIALENRIDETGATLDIGDVPGIDADAMQIRQLFQNLIGNALKFQRPGVPPHVAISGRLLAAVTVDGTLCEIRVRDNGIGFDERYRDRIFDLFQRLHPRQVYEGTGMGLAICRRIVARHGGTITAASTPGAGSTFIVTLPVRQRDEGHAREPRQG